MRNFLYFKEKNSITYTAAATDGLFAVKGTGVGDGAFFDSNVADTTEAGKVLRVTITSAAANTGNRGSDYANANTEIGTVTVLEPEALEIATNNLDIKKVSEDAQEGYDIKVGDTVKIEFIPLQDYGEGCFAADRFIGAKQTNATTTVVSFQSMEGNLDASISGDDTVTFTYASDTTGASHKKICDFFADAATNYRANNDGFIEVDRNENFPKQLVEAGVTRMQVAYLG